MGAICKRCNNSKPDGLRCPVCKRSYNVRYHKKHAEQLSLTNRNRQRAIRTAALKAYGGKCSCCNEARYEFLAIDHIDGGGTQHRKSLFKRNSGGHQFYYWLRKKGYPKGYRVLCHNCNMARGMYGYCPHEREKEMQCASTSMICLSPQTCQTEAKSSVAIGAT